MLTNGNFETVWNGDHTALAITTGGIQMRQVGNIFTPVGWTFWYSELGDYAQPEARYVHSSPDPVRVAEGSNAYLHFGFYRKQYAGLMQQVTLGPGRYRLSAKAHAWSNHQDSNKPNEFPHPDDPRWSEGAGYTSYFALVDTVTGDAERNFTFRLGIDLTGATNPLGNTVQFAAGAHIYNAYHELPPLEFELSHSKSITLFLSAKTLWAFKHNDAYWDDVRLERIAEPEPDCPGAPRVQYKRTALLVPPRSGSDFVSYLAELTFDTYRSSIFASADDAGIGALDDKAVIAVDPRAWGDDLEGFYTAYYPGVKFLPVWYDTERQLTGRVLARLLQRRGLVLAYPTTHWPPIVTSEFGVQRATYQHEGLDLASNRADDRVLCAYPGRVYYAQPTAQGDYGKFVVTESVLPDGQTMRIMYAHLDSLNVVTGQAVAVGDVLGVPDSTGNSTGDHLHIHVLVSGEYVDPELLIDFDTTPDPEPQGSGVYPEGATIGLGIHLLGGVDGLREYSRSFPSVYKSVLNVGSLGDVYSESPNTISVYRHWIPDQDQYRLAGDKIAAARAFLDLFLGDLLYVIHQHGIPTVYVESLNETYSHDTADNAHSVSFDTAFTQAVKEAAVRECIDLRPVTFTAAVGNPQIPERDAGWGTAWGQLLPMIRATIDAGGALGYHAYWLGNAQHPEWVQSEASYLQHRWQWFDSWLVDQGIHSHWILGEGGVVGGNIDGNGIHFAPSVGWRQLYGWQRYKAELLQFNAEVQDWNEQHGGRCAGLTMFQSGSGDPAWAGFDLQRGELLDLAGSV